jgi:hypothetical protein
MLSSQEANRNSRFTLRPLTRVGNHPQSFFLIHPNLQDDLRLVESSRRSSAIFTKRWTARTLLFSNWDVLTVHRRVREISMRCLAD